jgi:hypothetical protein
MNDVSNCLLTVSRREADVLKLMAMADRRNWSKVQIKFDDPNLFDCSTVP